MVGCGAGFLTQRLQQHGAEAYGVDTSSAAIALAAQKVDPSRLRCGTLAAAAFEPDFFDAAIAIHALEHIPDPVAFVTEVRRILEKDGVFLFRIPNFASWEAKLAGERWYHFDYPFHVSHYSPQAATRLLQTSGFRDVRVNHAAAEYRQTLLYSVLAALKVPLPLWLKIVLLPLQVVFIPLSWLLARLVHVTPASVEVHRAPGLPAAINLVPSADEASPVQSLIGAEPFGNQEAP